MPRDAGLEMIVDEALAETPGVTKKSMFGGLAYMVHGNLTFGARKGSLLARLGKGNDAWALETPGISVMASGKRTVPGWVRATPQAYSDDTLRNKLIQAALTFAATLPPKPVNQ
jgi:TfoX N-terminal domain